MRYAFRSSLAVQAYACATLIALAACGDDDTHETPSKGEDSGAKDSGAKDSGASDSGAMDAATADAALPDASAPDCFMDPQTHAEIINACTDAQIVDKDPELPLLLPDGGLPPLP